jgi:tetratricopeptide (TPR) repeat protein
MAAGHDAHDELEDLLAEALARHDEGGPDALAAFVAAHPAHAEALERGIRRCREMGLLGAEPAASHPERLGAFRLLRRIGGGGMGVVYEAEQEPLGRRVALKLIRPELLYFEGARERFRREVDAIARLQHPALVAVHAAGEHDGVPFLAMEMLDGITLEQACAAMAGRDPAALRGADLRALLRGPASGGELFAGEWWEAAVRIVEQAAQGLRHAHVRGIVHRDVKPSNIMVTPHGQAVVLDFGIAQVRAAQDLTRSGAVPGSPAFMSPEQRAGQATDERTDVWSLAATLWTLLALRRPFADAELLRGTAAPPPLPALRDHHRTAPRELDLVLRTAMDPDRERRYGNIGAFAADLRAVLLRRPIAARPLGRGLRLWRWCQRHRTTAVAAGIAAVAAAAVLVVLLVVQSAARRSLERNNELLRTAQADLERVNHALRAAKDDLEAGEARTRASLDTSLEALHGVVVRLGNDQLRGVPQAEGIAHGVLQDAAGLFRGLLASHPDDGRVRWRAGRALHALAMSFERQGDMAAAFATLREALAVLGDESPGSAALRNVRGHAWKTLASWLVPGPRRDEAVQAIERAEADFAFDAGRPDYAAEALRARAALASTRSLLFVERAEPEPVERWLREAIALQRDCIATGVVDDKDQTLLITYLANLGKFLQRRNRAEEALVVLREALPLAQALPERGIWPPAAVQLAEVQEAIGNSLVNQKDPAAEAILRACIAARERAAAQFPENAEFRIRLAGTVHNHARFLHAAGRTDEALAGFRRALALQREALQRAPGHPMALEFLQKHLEMIGYCHSLRQDGAALQATALELAAVPSRDPQKALRVADFHLRAWHFLGQSDPALLDQAMAQLEVAEQRGLRAAQLPTRGFEALDGRSDYRQWRERIAARQPGR